MSEATTQEKSPTAKMLGKPKKGSTAADVEVLGKDLIIEASKEIENLSKEQALALAKQLVDETDFHYFRLGGVLAVIQANDWWKDQGYENFKDFMSTEYGMPYRKGMYLVAIYNGLVAAKVPWEKVKALGWTKLKELAAILTIENADEWVDKASKMTTIQLIEHIKSLNEPTGGGDGAGTTGQSDVTTMTFKVHPDQKTTINDAIEKAKVDNKTEVATVALEFICMNYLEGKLGKKAAPAKFDPAKVSVEDLTAIFKNKTAEEVMNVFGVVFPDLEVTIAM